MIRTSLIVVLTSIALPSLAMAQTDAEKPAPTPEKKKSVLAPTPEAKTKDSPEKQPVKKQSSKIDAASKPKKQVQSTKIELNVLIKSSIRQAPAIKAAQAHQAFAKWQQYRAERAWFPKLSSTTLLAVVPANADPNRLDENFDEIANLNLGPFIRQNLRLIIPLYTFDRISSAKGLANLGVENARVSLNKEKVALAYDIKRAFYGIELARAFDALIVEGAKMLKSQLQEMKDARDFGDADFKIKDYRKLQIFQADFSARELDNKKLETLGLGGLNYLTARKFKLDDFGPLDDDPKLSDVENLDFYVQIAMKYRPEVLQLSKAIKARKLQVELSKSNFYPNIFFAADFAFGWSTEDVAGQPICRIPANTTECIRTDDLFARAYANPYDQLSFGVTLGMNWNFDFPQLYGKYREAETNLVKTQHQRRQAMGAISLELKKLHLEASHAFKKVGIYSTRLKAAERWRNQLGFGAQQGGSVADGLEPLKAYFEAKILHLQAIYNYRIARAALAKGIGVVSLDDAERQHRVKK